MYFPIIVVTLSEKAKGKTECLNMKIQVGARGGFSEPNSSIKGKLDALNHGANLRQRDAELLRQAGEQLKNPRDPRNQRPGTQLQSVTKSAAM